MRRAATVSSGIEGLTLESFYRWRFLFRFLKPGLKQGSALSAGHRFAADIAFAIRAGENSKAFCASSHGLLKGARNQIAMAQEYFCCSGTNFSPA